MSSFALATSSVLTPHRPVDDLVVSVRSLDKVHGRGSGAVRAFNAVSISIARARFTAIMGPSDPGKSTLMHCLAGLDSITSGEIMLDGDMIFSMNQHRLTHLCRERIGFIFQSFNLVSILMVTESITLPSDIARKKVNSQCFDRVIDIVGFGGCLSYRPAKLSGGQVQRTTCAWTLVDEPAIVFADKPTGNPDSHSTGRVLKILRRSVDDLGRSVVMVTREPEVAAWADTVTFLRNGHVVAQSDDPDRDRVLDALRELSETKPTPAAAPQSGSTVKGT